MPEEAHIPPGKVTWDQPQTAADPDPSNPNSGVRPLKALDPLGDPPIKESAGPRRLKSPVVEDSAVELPDEVEEMPESMLAGSPPSTEAPILEDVGQAAETKG